MKPGFSKICKFSIQGVLFNENNFNSSPGGFQNSKSIEVEQIEKKRAFGIPEALFAIKEYSYSGKIN